MDDQSLRSVLGILRLLNEGNTGHSAYSEIRRWCGDEVTDLHVVKVASYIIEQASLARTVIENSQLPDEAKRGILATINCVAAAFSLEQGNGAWTGHIRDVSAAISNIVILLGAMGIDTNREPPTEVAELASDISEMMRAFDDAELDPAVRDIGKRHLAILATLLQHIPVFGLEPALTTYFELLMKIRRADAGSTEKSHSKFVSLFESIKTFGERLSAIDKVWNSGARLLEHAGKAQDMLSYLPHS